MKKQNFLSRFLANVYVKNLLLMAGVALALIIVVLTALRFYTKHNESITVPAVKGLQAEEAMNILRSSGLGYEISDSVYQAEGVPGSVIEQVPVGKSNVKKGRTVFLIVKARGVQMIAIPELKDVSRRQAEAQQQEGHHDARPQALAVPGPRGLDAHHGPVHADASRSTRR